MNRRERFEGVLDYFLRHQPHADTELRYETPFQLLVAVILSAQCTDKRVNLTTPELFRHYPDAAALAKASEHDVYRLIRSISYPNSKSRHLVAMARMLMQHYGGQVPADPAELVKLPGVGRKTANVIASAVFQQPTLAVDTHVFRVARRIGLTVGARNPLQAEKQLTRYIPESLRGRAHHWLILHGRYVCKARKPLCSRCPLTAWCAYYERQEKNRSRAERKKAVRRTA
ncbi:MAG: endonuclease III [Chitinophagales bacterium]|nr:endonuclease III [Chitinophagales bacterium]MDW8393811.1 endonuclease III [Chitinophagales bacterium]